MPFNPISGVVTRIWKFVDQFTARDYALRSVFDQAFDDVVGSFNAALAYFFKNYSTRAEFEAATIPANVNYVIIAGLAYVRDTAGTAITSANIEKYGTILVFIWLAGVLSTKMAEKSFEYLKNQKFSCMKNMAMHCYCQYLNSLLPLL